MQLRKFAPAVLISLLAYCTVRVANAQTNDEAALSNDEKIFNLLELGTKYNRIVRPPPDYKSTNVVLIRFVVIKLLGLDEVGQYMSLEGYTEMEWNDRRLSWEDKFDNNYSTVSNIFLPRSAIWLPDVITLNTVDHKSDSKELALSTNVMYKGRVFTSSPFASKTMCDIDLLYFPFDSQTCSVKFGSWVMTQDALELKVLSQNNSEFVMDVDQQSGIESDEFCITKSNFEVTPRMEGGLGQEAIFTISIQRKPLFFIMNLIIPSFLILFISVFSFFLPPECSERLSLNITLMLTLMVFMQIVAGYTPAQSDSVPILTRFFASVVAITAVSTFGSVFTIYCHFKGNVCHQVDYAAIRLLFGIRCQFGGTTEVAKGSEIEEKAVQPDDGHGCTSEEFRMSRDEDTGNKSAGESEWHTVGRRLDYFLFISMLFCTAILAAFIGFLRHPAYTSC